MSVSNASISKLAFSDISRHILFMCSDNFPSRIFLLYLHTKIKWHFSKNLCLFLDLYTIFLHFTNKRNILQIIASFLCYSRKKSFLCRMKVIQKTYKFRLYPNKEQEKMLANYFDL